jgi:hypothetical protein
MPTIRGRRQSHYTKCYKLEVIIVGVIFILCSAYSYCSNFTVGSDLFSNSFLDVCDQLVSILTPQYLQIRPQLNRSLFFWFFSAYSQLVQFIFSHNQCIYPNQLAKVCSEPSRDFVCNDNPVIRS